MPKQHILTIEQWQNILWDKRPLLAARTILDKLGNGSYTESEEKNLTNALRAVALITKDSLVTHQ